MDLKVEFGFTKLLVANNEEVTTIANKNLGNRFIHGFSIDGFNNLSRNLKIDYSFYYIQFSLK